jgi:hypothetical protein
MSLHSNNKNSNSEEACNLSGFFLDDDGSIGQFDFNEEIYREKQIQLANRVEDLTNVALWGTKPKFAEYDYHLCADNDPKNFIGTATCVPGIPMYWQIVNGIAELKYREVESDRFKSTLLDADKLMKMQIRADYMNTDSYIIWAFQDCDMYWKVKTGVKFYNVIGRNTQVTDELPQEYKPQVFIPMNMLQVCHPGMFNKE